VLNAPGDLFDELARAHRRRWTHTDELLALILEKIDELLITTARLWSKPDGSRPRKPYRYPRPHAERRRGSTPAEIRRFFRGR